MNRTQSSSEADNIDDDADDTNVPNGVYARIDLLQ